MRGTVIIILFLFIQVSSFGQVIVRNESYYSYKPGIYKTKSVDNDLLALKPLVIEPQTVLIEGDNVGFIKIENEGIALFDRINDDGSNIPLGVLTRTSFIRVDTVFYRQIYKDPSKEWSLTFNVWYAININWKVYYTDYKIHDIIGYRKYLDSFSQEFFLIAQNTGYDEFYDNGYPSHFFVVILDKQKELIFSSSILDFDFADEFWEEEFVKSQMTDKGFEFIITGIDNEYKAIWTGKELQY